MSEAEGVANKGNQSREVPLLYFNGFELSSSLSDFGVMIMYDGAPIGRIAMSFTTAKTLSLQLQGAISAFEEASGQPLLSMDDVGRAFQAAQEKGAESGE